jgi:hypothetical protein
MTYYQGEGKRRENLFPFITFRHKIKEKKRRCSEVICEKQANLLCLGVAVTFSFRLLFPSEAKRRENRKSFVIEKSVQQVSHKKASLKFLRR